MWSYIVKGGWVMGPIVFCSIVALAVALERLYSLRESKIHPKTFTNKIKKLLNEQKVNEAMAVCGNSVLPISKIIEAGIMKIGSSREEIKEAIEHAGRQESSHLQKYLTVLGTVVGVAPLLGLLGTVTGMIEAFNVIALKGAGHPTELAGGISEALITTAAGLIIAIPTLVVYNYFYKKVNGFILDMENTSMELLDVLSKDQKGVGRKDSYQEEPYQSGSYQRKGRLISEDEV